MDNRINEIRRKISVLRAKMMELEAVIRGQIALDLDCTKSALRLMAMRQELSVMVDEWKAAGGSDRLPTVQERLKGKLSPDSASEKPKRSARR